MNLYGFLKATETGYDYRNWHFGLVCKYYQMLIERKIKRLMIMLPKRHCATTLTKTSFNYALGVNQNEKCCYVSSMAIGRKKTQGITVIRTGASIVGESYSMITIDNPVKSIAEAESSIYQQNLFDWHTGTLKDRVQDDNSIISIIASRKKGINDTMARLLKEEGILTYNSHKPSAGCPDWNGKDNGIWTVLSLPLIMNLAAYKFKHPEDHRGAGETLWPKKGKNYG